MNPPRRSGDGVTVFIPFLWLPLTTARSKGKRAGDEGRRKKSKDKKKRKGIVIRLSMYLMIHFIGNC